MTDRLRQWLETLRSSYWFIPSVMSLGALVLAGVVPRLDTLLGSEWIEAWMLLGPNQPAGARSLLSTVAGSMITVAGVAFSITIAAVAYATAQYGPRLLANFMRDTGNQVTLGVFIATYLYCIIVLRVIREPAGSAEDVVAFVPHLAILVALIMALLSVGVLIYFFHHVPESIHASNVIGDVGRTLQHRLASLFPDQIGEQAEEPESDAPPPAGHPLWRTIEVEDGGYLKAILGDRLLDLAEGQDAVVQLSVRPGDFVSDRAEVARIWAEESPPDGWFDDVRHCFVRGNRRTDQQDVRFLVNELVEIGARALSPGVNDPFTAITCIDWLCNGLGVAARGNPRNPHRMSEAGRLRVVATPVGFDDLSEAALGGLRSYAAADPNTAVYLAEKLSHLIRTAPVGHVRGNLEAHVELFLAACDELLPLEADRRAVHNRLAQT